MKLSLAHNWCLLVLRGLLSIAFGMSVLWWPSLAWLTVVWTFVVYAWADGVFAVVAALRRHERGEQWGSLLLEGLASISTVPERPNTRQESCWPDQAKRRCSDRLPNQGMEVG